MGLGCNGQLQVVFRGKKERRKKEQDRRGEKGRQGEQRGKYVLESGHRYVEHRNPCTAPASQSPGPLATHSHEVPRTPLHMAFPQHINTRFPSSPLKSHSRSQDQPLPVFTRKRNQAFSALCSDLFMCIYTVNLNKAEFVFL